MKLHNAGTQLAKLLTLAVVAGAVALAAPAKANAQVSFGIRIGAPVYARPYYAPPVYVGPAYGPPAAYVRPGYQVGYAGGYYAGQRQDWREDRREEWRQDRREDWREDHRDWHEDHGQDRDR